MSEALSRRELMEKSSRIATGKEKAPFVLKNARIINVLTNELIKGDIAICGEYIVGIGSYDGEQEMELDGAYVSAGFVDSHIHLESTLVRPTELVAHAVQKGTLTFIVDPHESANVSGLDGIEFILDQTADVSANVYVMCPSCVPAADGELNGAIITAADMERFIDNPRVLGLGEVMDCPSVVSGRESMLDKLELFADKHIDGHAPSLTGRELQAYVASGVSTDHENTTFAHALEERRAGMTVLIREASGAKNLCAIVDGIVESGIPTDGFCFCTDDKFIEEIDKEGHINFSIRKAIERGLDPFEAYKMATYNAARAFGLKRCGAVAPGMRADLVILDDMINVTVRSTIFGGKPVELDMENIPTPPVPEKLLHTVNMKLPDISKLMMSAERKASDAIEVVRGQILTKQVKAQFPVIDGQFAPNRYFNKLAVFERYNDTGLVGVCSLSGLWLRGGAIATSVSHDSHNIIAAGDSDESIIRAVNYIIENQGGMVVVKGDEVFGIPLSIMGLMSSLSGKEVIRRHKHLQELVHGMGVPEEIAPFMELSFLALPVIPEIRLTPKGLIKVQ